MSSTVAAIATALGLPFEGRGDLIVESIRALEDAGPQDISFVHGARNLPRLAASRAGCVIVAPAFAAQAAGLPARILAPDPYLAYARLTRWWQQRQQDVPAGPAVHPSAVVDPTAHLGPGVRLGPFAVIGARCVVGEGAQVGAHTVLEADASIGRDTRLAAHVVIGTRCSLGERCIVHSGVVIGADGFGFAPAAGGWEKIEQLGAVRIGSDVEIGANTCIDRGALGDTVLEDGVKLDNLIQIAHNVHLGRNVAMAACSGVAGSAVIGAGCTIGGSAGIAGHIELVEGVHISAHTLVSRSIRKPGVYSGAWPFEDNASWEKNAATARQLHALRDRVRTLERKP